MRTETRPALSLIFWILVAAISPGRVVGAEEDGAILDVLDAAVNQWRQDIAFRSTFVFRQGTTPSKEDGLAGEFGSRVGKPQLEDRATGVLHKRGSEVRLSLDYGRPPDDATQDGSSAVVTNVSFEGVATRDLYLDYLPKYGDFGNQVSIFKRPDRDHDILKAGTNGGHVEINPFSFGGGEAGSPLASFARRPEFVETVTKRVAERTDDRLTVEMVRVGETSNHETVRQTMRITFLMSASPPVIVRKEQIANNEVTKQHSEGVQVAADFATCEGGVIARRVRSIAGPVMFIGEDSPLWIAREWQSEDLGASPPSKSDFVIEIPPSVNVVGIKRPPAAGTKRKIDLASYTVDDLIDHDSGPPYAPSSDFMSEDIADDSSARWRAALGASAAVLGIVLIGFFVRGYRARGV